MVLGSPMPAQAGGPEDVKTGAVCTCSVGRGAALVARPLVTALPAKAGALHNAEAVTLVSVLWSTECCSLSRIVQGSSSQHKQGLLLRALSARAGVLHKQLLWEPSWTAYHRCFQHREVLSVGTLLDCVQQMFPAQGRPVHSKQQTFCWYCTGQCAAHRSSPSRGHQWTQEYFCPVC